MSNITKKRMSGELYKRYDDNYYLVIIIFVFIVYINFYKLVNRRVRKEVIKLNKTLPEIKPNKVLKLSLPKKDIEKTVLETNLLLGAMTNFLKNIEKTTDKENK